MADPPRILVAAVKANDVLGVREALEKFPELKPQLNDPLPGLPFDTPAMMTAVRHGNREMIDVLLEAGADINAVSRWWAGGFGALDAADPSLVPFLLERGAVVGPHAAARLGMIDTLESLVTRDPSLVHARGGDGQTPLHFASSVEVARLLLDRGADVNARDVDHESTPAQYMVRDRQEVARYLISRGSETDILLASALGDLERVREHLDRNPDAIRTSVSERWFPKRDARAGGTIYIWTLGAHKTAHQIARERGHDDVLRELLERSPAAMKLAMACERGDEPTMRALLDADPEIRATLTDDDRARLAYAAQENDTKTVARMLAAGWPVDAEGQHRGTALHWAAFHGNLAMVEELLRRGPDLDKRDADHEGTALDWAIYGSVHGWHCRTGDYAGTVEALLWAGSQPPDVSAVEASEPVRNVLRRHARSSGADG